MFTLGMGLVKCQIFFINNGLTETTPNEGEHCQAVVSDLDRPGCYKKKYAGGDGTAAVTEGAVRVT
jgi:hypothetical protein